MADRHWIPAGPLGHRGTESEAPPRRGLMTAARDHHPLNRPTLVATCDARLSASGPRVLAPRGCPASRVGGRAPACLGPTTSTRWRLSLPSRRGRRCRRPWWSAGGTPQGAAGQTLRMTARPWSSGPPGLTFNALPSSWSARFCAERRDIPRPPHAFDHRPTPERDATDPSSCLDLVRRRWPGRRFCSITETFCEGSSIEDHARRDLQHSQDRRRDVSVLPAG